MRKKNILTAVLLIFCMLFQTLVFAVTESPNREERSDLAVEFLDAIGVFPDFGPLYELDMEKNISRSEFAEAMVKASGSQGTAAAQITFSDVPADHPRADYIAAAVGLGLMNGYGDGSFLPDYPVKYEEAIKVAVTALGYGARAQLKGGYPWGYLGEADRLSMLEDVSGKIGTFITVGDFAMLLTNTLNTEILEIESISGEDVTLNTHSNTTMLKSSLGIYRATGQVTQTERSSLTGVTSLKKGTAVIGEKFYKSDGSNVTDWLGHYVTAYYKNDNELLFVWPQRHETLTVAAKDILPDSGKFSVTCLVYQDDSGKSREAKISPYADLIYNGVSVGGYNTADMVPDNGWVKLVDNNRDNQFDVIFVEEYRDIIVGSVDAKSFTVRNLENSSDFVELNSAEYEKYFFSIEMDGIETGFESIAVGDVLSVFESKNTDGIKFRRVIISKNNIVGMLKSKAVEDDETTVIIDETEYDVSDYFLDNFSSLPIQTNGRFVLNFEGVLVGFSGNAERINVYGYLLNAGMQGTFSGKAQFKMLTEYGEIEIFTAAERLNVDGQNYKGAGAQADLINGTKLKQKDSFRQLVRYKLNEDGFITELDTVNAGARTADELTEDFSSESRYFYSGSFGLSKFDFAVNSAETAVFIVPKQEKYFDVEERYSGNLGTSTLREGTQYEITAFDADENLTAGAVVVVQDVSKSPGNSMRAVIVDKVSMVTGDIVKLTGFQNGKYITRYVEDAEAQARVKTFRQGDLIVMTDDVDGRLVYARKLFTPTLNLDIDNFKIANATDFDKIEDANGKLAVDGKISDGDNDNVIFYGSNSDDLQAQFRGEYGVLLRKNDNKVVLSGRNSDNTPNTDDIAKMSPMSIASNAVVTIYTKADETVKVGLISDLDKYIYSRNPDARIFIHTYVGVVRDIFVFDLSE